jgi:hypothetical protein
MPGSDERQYHIEGYERMTVFASGGKARTFNYQAGDVMSYLAYFKDTACPGNPAQINDGHKTST